MSVETAFSIEVIDEEILSYLRKFSNEQWPQEATRALQIGVAVLNKIAINNDMHYLDAQVTRTLSTVEKEFQALAAGFQNQLLLALDPQREGSYLAQASHNIETKASDLSTSLNTVIQNTQEMLLHQLRMLGDEYSKIDFKLNPTNEVGYLGVIHNQILHFESNLAKQFNETDTASFVGKLRTCVGNYFGENGEILQLFDEKLKMDLEGKTPLGQLFVGLKTEISLLRDTVVRIVAKQELLDQTTKKGFVFEEVVLERLEEIARPLSDIVEDVSLKSEAISNSKKGDFLYQYGDSGVKVVLDAKNYGKLKSLPAMLAYIKEAIKERDAKFGIIVAPNEQSLQKQIGCWNAYNNCIVCTLDSLSVALKYAKYYVQLSTSESAGLNVGGVQMKLEEVGRTLKEFTSMKSKLTKLSNGVATAVQEIQSLIDETRDRIQQLLEEIDQEFKKAHN
jgi:hypothetical protein